ncbi:MAG: PHP domain-containing protein [Ruminococcaceae bacterium]|nr:PHP domain-containing protein [Oscillospiraceae bacterium]
MIHSDWHIHTTASYDAALPIEELIRSARAQGLRRIGVTDHLNYNDEKFRANLRESAENYKKIAASAPEVVLGVELTPIARPYYDYIARTGTREGYVPPVQDEPYAIDLPATKEELVALGVRYSVGASHWRVDVGDILKEDSAEVLVNEWFRQQMWLAQDERVTILGHPWNAGHAVWYDDFSIVPWSMHEELAAALKENGKYVECNVSFFRTPKTSERFRNRYAEMLRMFFEKGIPITYGSDCHGKPDGLYPDRREDAVRYLSTVGFKDGDFSELAEKDLW